MLYKEDDSAKASQQILAVCLGLTSLQFAVKKSWARKALMSLVWWLEVLLYPCPSHQTLGNKQKVWSEDPTL